MRLNFIKEIGLALVLTRVFKQRFVPQMRTKRALNLSVHNFKKSWDHQWEAFKTTLTCRGVRAKKILAEQRLLLEKYSLQGGENFDN